MEKFLHYFRDDLREKPFKHKNPNTKYILAQAAGFIEYPESYCIVKCKANELDKKISEIDLRLFSKSLRLSDEKGKFRFSNDLCFKAPYNINGDIIHIFNKLSFDNSFKIIERTSTNSLKLKSLKESTGKYFDKKDFLLDAKNLYQYDIDDEGEISYSNNFSISSLYPAVMWINSMKEPKIFSLSPISFPYTAENDEIAIEFGKSILKGINTKFRRAIPANILLKYKYTDKEIKDFCYNKNINFKIATSKELVKLISEKKISFSEVCSSSKNAISFTSEELKEILNSGIFTIEEDAGTFEITNIVDNLSKFILFQKNITEEIILDILKSPSYDKGLKKVFDEYSIKVFLSEKLKSTIIDLLLEVD